MTLPRPLAPPIPEDLDTPALVIDLDVVERNARRMADLARAQGIALRPHVKTHKSVGLARIQMEKGAIGVTVGTLGEAEAMADGAIEDIFVAYPLWASAPKAARLRALLARDDLRLSVGIDSEVGARQLAEAVAGSRRALRVLVEVDPHYGRTGAPPSRVGDIGAAAARLGLDVLGVFAHGGHGYAGPDAARSAGEDEVEALTLAADALRRHGIEARVLSAGSSPTAGAAARPPVTELRPGTYLVGDRQQVALGASPPDGVAIAVAATVVSDAVPGQVVIDAGAKSLTKDAPAYLSGFGTMPAYPDGVIERVSDYHGQVSFPSDARRPVPGEVVAVVPNHACPTIDLYDSFLATRSGEVVATWRVHARGRSR